jgi:nucleotide-binding universal stress UspA family protein
MSGRRCVVCGVDGSPAARAATAAASLLAQRLGLRLVLAHVSPPPLTLAAPHVVSAAPVGELETIDFAARALLDGAADEAGVSDAAELRVDYGDPVERLLAIAEEDDVELLAVGSRALGAWRSALLGSVSAALASRASCPVLVVREHAEEPVRS